MPRKKGNKAGPKCSKQNGVSARLRRKVPPAAPKRPIISVKKIEELTNSTNTNCNGSSTSNNSSKTVKRKQAKVVNVTEEKRALILNSISDSNNTRNKAEFECDFCDFVADIGFHLRTHMEIKHTNNEEYFPCSMCSFTATNQKLLDIHTLSQHKKGRWPCNTCEQSFMGAGELYKHIKKQHSNT